jgi:hypothetical protein
MPQVDIKVEGLNELIDRVRSDELLARPWRRALGRISMNIKKMVRAEAATHSLSGRTARGVFYKMKREPMPLYSIVSDRAKRKGARYPFVVNAGHRRMSYGDVQLHWRGTGQSTAGWFTSLQNHFQGLINNALGTAVDQLLNHWDGKRNG